MKKIILLLLIATINISYSQQYDFISWDPVMNQNTMTGSANGVTVTVSQTNIGNQFNFTSPYNGLDLIGTERFAFVTQNNPSIRSRELTFNFSRPIYIHLLNIGDINLSPIHNDSFIIRGIEFNDYEVFRMQGNINSGTAQAIDSGYGIWKYSTTQVSSFTIRFIQTQGVTHSYVKYSIAISEGPNIVDNSSCNCNFYPLRPYLICPDQPYEFIAEEATEGHRYIWSFRPVNQSESQIIPNSENLSTLIIDNPQEGWYSVVILDENGNCIGSFCRMLVYNNYITPTFSNLPSIICPDDPIPNLPIQSVNNIFGDWEIIENNSDSIELVFIPIRELGLCYNSYTHTIYKRLKEPIFTQHVPVCKVDFINLPTVSNNNIIGIWSIINRNETEITYKFTPLPDQCAETATMTIQFSDKETPVFDISDELCEDKIAELPTLSLNGISGSWILDEDFEDNMNYLFIPDDLECFEKFSLLINKVQTPIFNSHQDVCHEDMISLKNVSINGFTGSWFKSNETPDYFEYTFNPDEECVKKIKTTILKIKKITPEFDIQQDFYCSLEEIKLPEVSMNNIKGKWILKDATSATFIFEPDDLYCNNTITVQLNLYENSPITLNYHCLNNVFTVMATSKYKSYNWFINDLFYESSEKLVIDNNILSLMSLPITITLKTLNSNNCPEQSSIIIYNTLCTIQKGISPNGDGYNDYFNLTNLKVSELIIYNRYGTKVFTAKNYSDEWRGQSNNGQQLPDATYFYILNFNDGRKTITGWINLIN